MLSDKDFFISYTKLKTFKTCLLKFKKKYIEKKIELKTPALIKGTEIHDTIANNILNKKENIYNENISRFLYENIINKRNITKYYVERDFFIPFVKSKKGNKYIKLDGKIDFYGIISNDPSRILIIDWKTGNSEGDIEQLKFYSLLFLMNESKNIPINYTEGYFYYIDGNYYSKYFFPRDEILEYKEILKNNIVNMIKLYQKYETNEEIFDKPTPNQFCQFCSFISECVDYFYDNEHLIEIVDDGTLKKKIEEYFMLNSYLKNLENKIKEYLINNQIYEIYMEDILKKLKIEFDHILSLKNMTKTDIIETIIKNNENKSYSYNELKSKKISELKEILFKK